MPDVRVIMVPLHWLIIMKEEKKSREKSNRARERSLKKTDIKSTTDGQPRSEEVDGYRIFTNDSIGRGTYGEVFVAHKEGSD